jgi:hypothetical protein
MGGETQKTINFDCSWVFTVSFFFSERLHWCYIIFTAPTCRAAIIPLEPCALNGEIQHHFVLGFSISYWDLIKFPYFTDTTKRGIRGERRPKDRVKTGWICGWLYCKPCFSPKKTSLNINRWPEKKSPPQP